MHTQCPRLPAQLGCMQQGRAHAAPAACTSAPHLPLKLGAGPPLPHAPPSLLPSRAQPPSRPLPRLPHSSPDGLRPRLCCMRWLCRAASDSDQQILRCLAPAPLASCCCCSCPLAVAWPLAASLPHGAWGAWGAWGGRGSRTRPRCPCCCARMHARPARPRGTHLLLAASVVCSGPQVFLLFLSARAAGAPCGHMLLLGGACLQPAASHPTWRHREGARRAFAPVDWFCRKPRDEGDANFL